MGEDSALIIRGAVSSIRDESLEDRDLEVLEVDQSVEPLLDEARAG
jgi:hypothetical protein